MKHFLILLILGSSLLFLGACSDGSTNNDDKGFGSTESYTTANVKTAGSQFFSFESKTATTTMPAAFDLQFTVDSRVTEVGVNSCTYFNVSADPIIKGGPGVELSRVVAASLEDIDTVPADEAFMIDDTITVPLIGRTWLGEGYVVNPDVYVFKTCAGKFGLLQIKSFEMDFDKMQIASIKWHFKYNMDGSNDFSNAIIDSFATDNAYDQTRNWSFAEGSLPMAYGTWEVSVEGSTIWLGPEVQIYKLEDTDINDVTTISDSGFMGDDLTYYACAGWYDSDENHTVIPNDFVYMAKTSNDDVIAFEITNYYDNMGNSGAFTIEWKTFED